jgi:hypothetical protein
VEHWNIGTQGQKIHEETSVGRAKEWLSPFVYIARCRSPAILMRQVNRGACGGLILIIDRYREDRPYHLKVVRAGLALRWLNDRGKARARMFICLYSHLLFITNPSVYAKAIQPSANLQ